MRALVSGDFLMGVLAWICMVRPASALYRAH
jgi:hypothetical protein